MKFSLTTLLLAALCAPAASAQVWVGADAPEVEVKQWFNPTSGSGIAELKGKVIMLEFWATW